MDGNAKPNPRGGSDIVLPVPLSLETRTIVDTATAAAHLGRKPQTLRRWACDDSGPLRPTKVHGRLGWHTADLRALLGVPE